MSDRVADMTEAGNGNSVLFINFIRLASNKNLTICFFEGEDQKYYLVRLNLIGEDLKWAGIDCGGKKKVLEICNLVSQHPNYKDHPVVGFVDKDFDIPLSKLTKANLIYETPCYSIENLYCTDDCILEVLNVEFKFNKNPNIPNLLNLAFQQFKNARDEFHKAIEHLNFWVKAHRKVEKIDASKKLNLHNVSINKIVQIQVGAVKKVVFDTEIPSLFPECASLSYAFIAESSIDFPNFDRELHFRGKYELEFVRQYLILLKNQSCDIASPLHNPQNAVRLQFSKNNFISELSQYASTPDCLKLFIKKMKGRVEVITE